jgi:hypothetical protein
MGQDACGSDNKQGMAKGVVAVFARNQPIARREGELHAVGKADHHDQRRHDVQEQIEPETHPAERTEAEQDGGERWPGSDDHERDPPKEHDCNQASGRESDRVVDHPVALHGVADLELHDRHAGQARLEAGSGQVGVSGLMNVAHDAAQASAVHCAGIEREHDQRQSAVGRKQLAADDLVRGDALDELLIGGAARKLLGNQRCRQLAVLRGLPRREHGDDAPRPVDELQIGDEVAQLCDRGTLQQALAIDDDQDIVLARWEQAGLALIQPEFGRIGPEQLTEGVVDPDSGDAERRCDAGNDGQYADDRRKPQGKQANALDAERQVVAVQPYLRKAATDVHQSTVSAGLSGVSAGLSSSDMAFRKALMP